MTWPRRAAVVAAALLSMALAIAACGARSGAPPLSPAPSFPASPVDGVIVAVDASSLSDVRGFTLLLAGGSTVAFKLGALENPTDFPPGHLKEHQATSEPIRVFFRVEGGVPVAYRLADATG